ncbi:hypothetical protein ACOMHN_009091 [Nucella lapillus]
MLVQSNGLFKSDKNGNPTHDPDPDPLTEGLKAGGMTFHINELPDEVLVRVFSYLHPIQHELPALALVCRTWRRVLAGSGCLWRDLRVDPRGYRYWHFSLLCAIFRLYGQHVQRLTWHEHSPVYESVFSLIPRLSGLRHLRLPILWTRAVVESLSPLSRLEHVQVNGGFSLTDDDLARVGQSFPDLKAVTLNACWSVSAKGTRHFLGCLPGLTSLKLKVNSGLPLNDVRSERAMGEGGRMVQMVADSAWAPAVSVLCLHFVPIEMDELWTVVKRMTCLKKLSVSNCENCLGHTRGSKRTSLGGDSVQNCLGHTRGSKRTSLGGDSVQNCLGHTRGSKRTSLGGDSVQNCLGHTRGSKRTSLGGDSVQNCLGHTRGSKRTSLGGDSVQNCLGHTRGSKRTSLGGDSVQNCLGHTRGSKRTSLGGDSVQNCLSQQYCQSLKQW